MTDNRQETDRHEEELVSRLLAATGQRPALPDELRERWESTFRDELARQRASARRRTTRWTALAAAIGTLALGLLLLPLREAQDFGRIVAHAGHSEVDGQGEVAVGQRVSAGQTLRSGPSGYLTVVSSGVELRMAPNTLVVTGTGSVELLEGSLYVDTGGSAGSGRLAVITAFGEVTHLGTQYLVEVSDSWMTAAVREGVIHLATPSARNDYAASQDSATRVRVMVTGRLEVSSIARHGEFWSWIEGAGPGLVVLDRTAHQALAWAARENGQRLEYASSSARTRAEEVLTAPSDRAMSASEILGMVALVTYLQVDVSDGGAILVSERNHEAD